MVVLKRTVAVLGVFGVLALGGCGSNTHESLRTEAAGKMKQMVAILQTVTDETSAKAAAPKIEAIGKEITALIEADDKLPKMSAEEEKALNAKIEASAKSDLDAMRKESMRIMALGPKVMEPINTAMNSVKPMK